MDKQKLKVAQELLVVIENKEKALENLKERLFDLQRREHKLQYYWIGFRVESTEIISAPLSYLATVELLENSINSIEIELKKNKDEFARL